MTAFMTGSEDQGGSHLLKNRSFGGSLQLQEHVHPTHDVTFVVLLAIMFGALMTVGQTRKNKVDVAPKSAVSMLRTAGRAGGYWGHKTSEMIFPVCREICFVVALGTTNIMGNLALSGWSATGYCIRLGIALTQVLIVSLPDGLLPSSCRWNKVSCIHGFSLRLCPALQPHDDTTGRTLWFWFVWGKYLGVAGLEIITCIACLTVDSASHSWLHNQLFTWTAAAILAFNIAECAVLEAHVSRVYKGQGVGVSASVNVFTGIVLTVLSFVLAYLHPATITANGFNYNHPLSFSIAYALWNIKFASCCQDDGTLLHIGHSHIPAMTACLLLGTDYMEYRVAALAVHFSMSAVFSQIKANNLSIEFKKEAEVGTRPKLPTIGRMIGFGAFYDLFMWDQWMKFTAWGAAVATIWVVAGLIAELAST